MLLSDQPLVSVIIPSYNHANFIGKAIQSVLDQTYNKYEIIVIDNHSNDGTHEIVASFGNTSVIRMLDINNNGIIAASRNMGISAAQGEWVAFLDSDDSWMPDKLEKTMQAAAMGEERPYDVICHNEVKIYEDSLDQDPLTHGPHEEDFYQALLMGGNRLSTSATVVRRDFLLKYNLQFNESKGFVTAEDYALWLELARFRARFYFINETLGEYFIHKENNSGSLQRHFKNIENLLHYHVYKVQEFSSNKNKVWSKILPRLRFSEIKLYLLSKKFYFALKIFIKTIFEIPVGSISYIANKFIKCISRSRR